MKNVRNIKNMRTHSRELSSRKIFLLYLHLFALECWILLTLFYTQQVSRLRNCIISANFFSFNLFFVELGGLRVQLILAHSLEWEFTRVVCPRKQKCRENHGYAWHTMFIKLVVASRIVRRGSGKRAAKMTFAQHVLHIYSKFPPGNTHVFLSVSLAFSELQYSAYPNRQPRLFDAFNEVSATFSESNCAKRHRTYESKLNMIF